MFRPPSLLASQVAPTAANIPQGSRGFYIRAYRASLPLHAPDMLSVRIQAIDGERTSTFLDLQPCRLLRVPPYAITRHITSKAEGTQLQYYYTQMRRLLTAKSPC